MTYWGDVVNPLVGRLNTMAMLSGSSTLEIYRSNRDELPAFFT